LTLSVEKTKILLMRFKVVTERPPIIKINGENIRRRQVIKYLGVLFECGLRINKHVQETVQKCRNLFNTLAKVAKAKWGLGQAAIRTLYKGMFQPMTTYVTAD
jgi:hypothetical protein